jgi:hypothetical protein
MSGCCKSRHVRLLKALGAAVALRRFRHVLLVGIAASSTYGMGTRKHGWTNFCVPCIFCSRATDTAFLYHGQAQVPVNTRGVLLFPRRESFLWQEVLSVVTDEP